MLITKELRTYALIITLPFIFLFYLLIVSQKDILALPMLISIANFYLVLFALMTKYFQHIIFRIYFVYHIMTMVAPIFMLVIPYSDTEALLFLKKYMVSENDILKSNILILAYDLIMIFSVIIFHRINLFKNKQATALRFYLSDQPKYILILVIALISYSMKIYLISIGAWFMFMIVDLRQYAFANTAEVIQKLDILVLLYISYSYKYDKSKTMLFIMTFIISISLFFAIISTSKAKLFMVLIPVLMLLVQTKYKNFFILLSVIFFLSSGFLFKYMMYLRLHTGIPLIENTQQFIDDYKSTNTKKNIFEDDLLIRLGYQIVFSRAVKVYDTPDFQYKNDYLNNVVGLIPRALWPTKPIIGIDGNKIGHDLGVLGKYDNVTSIGITPIGEAFYTLNYAGIFIVPIVISFLMFLFSKLFIQTYWLGYLLSIIFGITIATTDWYNPLIPTLLKIFIIFYVFGLLLNRKFSDNIKLNLVWKR